MLACACLMANRSFADWLNSELHKREWTKAELSRRSGVSQSQLSRAMTGERGKPTPDEPLFLC